MKTAVRASQVIKCIRTQSNFESLPKWATQACIDFRLFMSEKDDKTLWVKFPTDDEVDYSAMYGVEGVEIIIAMRADKSDILVDRGDYIGVWTPLDARVLKRG
jgi:hypothetical protein